ncbi:FAD-dependent oxidoreductase [Ciceribacter naphthalenivorans]|uniref:FAD-dependent oxidoreductase n=3 Tax=Alphaproteobacteria TaxID=28211 RepID=A0A512HL85_9HYPH|nr:MULTISPECIES: FAD-dependent oxidoreductase [Alphaproteobacteria]GEO86160.1 FAD-dependent oxidoreductase [Ciceribacter naphthalenivorans]GLR22727.1 FAD-dependent oxidoreductase [Ciceribacter naphthalenivorans]GLT05583.1 FAD-dependent oxidoreductase [Sphingomonas psychrolutea]
MPFSTPIWLAPQSSKRPATPIEVNEEVDLVIVGAGFQGLSAAFHAVALGLKVRVIEAAQVGSGASGLNGGQVIPGLKYDPEWLLAHFGPERGEALARFAASTADAVFDLIDHHQLDVPRKRNGWIQAAHTQTASEMQAERHRQWVERGADVALLDARQIAEMTGTSGYVGGWLDRRAGIINPLAFVLELARLASDAGARIAENERVSGLRHETGLWVVSTQSGKAVRAKSVLVATNAYSDGLVPGLRQSLVPLHSFQIATAPLTAAQDAAILPGGHAISDSRRILVYYRKTADGRLAMGGRGRLGLPRSADDWAHIERAMRRVFPALEDTPIERRWYGRVAMTMNHLPHIHEPEPGLLMAAGCQGRGVGLMTALGPYLAHYVTTGDPAALPFPITPIRPIPFHAFRQIGVSAAIAWYRLLDSLER